MTVSIIVPCRNEKAHIAAFLQSLDAQVVPAGVTVEVLIADGASDDGTRAVLEAFATCRTGIRVIDNPGRIVPTGLNAAIRASTGEVIIRMDVHSEYAPDYVAQCLAALSATGADNVGGPARTRASTYMQHAISAAYHSPFACGGARFHDVTYQGPVDTVTYGCWRRETLERLGLFDELFVRNQDDELNLRIRRGNGLIWQTPSIRSWYRPRGSLRALFRQYFQYGFWKVFVIRKHRLPASWRHLVPGLFFASLAFLAAAGFFAPAAWAALAVLVLFYLAAALAAAVLTGARENNWGLVPVLPAVFATYHAAYGFGFLRGLFALATGKVALEVPASRSAASSS
ncbi:MAG: glycosyltransferase family 2 protein [Bryobacteraceae bacterium]